MAIFQLEIADGDVERVLTAVAHNGGWQEMISNPDHMIELDEEGNVIPPVDAEGNPIPEMITNPETKGQFTHKMVRNFLAQHVSAYEINEAKRLAVEAVDPDVNISDPDV